MGSDTDTRSCTACLSHLIFWFPSSNGTNPLLPAICPSARYVHRIYSTQAYFNLPRVERCFSLNKHDRRKGPVRSPRHLVLVTSELTDYHLSMCVFRHLCAFFWVALLWMCTWRVGVGNGIYVSDVQIYLLRYKNILDIWAVLLNRRFQCLVSDNACAPVQLRIWQMFFYYELIYISWLDSSIVSGRLSSCHWG